MKKASLVILISGRGSNMKAIYEACHTGDLPAYVACVISNKGDAPGLDFAKAEGIEHHILSHEEFSSREDFDRALANLIRPYEPDFICLAGFMRILGADFVSQFSGKVLNIHPSLLPKYKGLNTHQRALDAGDNKAGCSVHYVTEELDGGEVIYQAEVPIMRDDTACSLAERVLSVEHGAYVKALASVLD